MRRLLLKRALRDSYESRTWYPEADPLPQRLYHLEPFERAEMIYKAWQNAIGGEEEPIGMRYANLMPTSVVMQREVAKYLPKTWRGNKEIVIAQAMRHWEHREAVTWALGHWESEYRRSLVPQWEVREVSKFQSEELVEKYEAEGEVDLDEVTDSIYNSYWYSDSELGGPDYLPMLLEDVEEEVRVEAIVGAWGRRVLHAERFEHLPLLPPIRYASLLPESVKSARMRASHLPSYKRLNKERASKRRLHQRPSPQLINSVQRVEHLTREMGEQEERATEIRRRMESTIKLVRNEMGVLKEELGKVRKGMREMKKDARGYPEAHRATRGIQTFSPQPSQETFPSIPAAAEASRNSVDESPLPNQNQAVKLEMKREIGGDDGRNTTQAKLNAEERHIARITPEERVLFLVSRLQNSETSQCTWQEQFQKVRERYNEQRDQEEQSFIVQLRSGKLHGSRREEGLEGHVERAVVVERGRTNERPDLDTGSGWSPSLKLNSDHRFPLSVVSPFGSNSLSLQRKRGNDTLQDREFADSIIDNLMSENDEEENSAFRIRLPQEERGRPFPFADNQTETLGTIEVWREGIPQPESVENTANELEIGSTALNRVAQEVTESPNTLNSRNLRDPDARFPSDLQIYRVNIGRIPTIAELISQPAVVENTSLTMIRENEAWMSAAQSETHTPRKFPFLIGTLSATASSPPTLFPSPLVLTPWPAMVPGRPPDALGEPDSIDNKTDFNQYGQDNATECLSKPSDLWKQF